MVRKIAAVFLFVLAATSAAAEVTINAEISRQVVSLGDNLQYSIVLSSSDENINMAQFEIKGKPSFEGLEVINPSASRSSQQQISNFQSVETQRLSWQLRATREGTAKISAGEAIYKGRSYPLAAFEVKVIRDEMQPGATEPAMQGVLHPQSGISNLDQQLRGRLFARLTASNPNPYLQEMVLVTCKVYFDPQLTGQIGNVGWQAPNWVDLFAQEMKQPSEPRLQTETLFGKQFSTVIVKQYLLSPTRAGKIEIPLSSGECSVRVRSAPSGFEQDFFGDSFFGSSIFDRAVPIRLPIAPLTLDVKPLPANGRPVSFQNAVGIFDFVARIDREEMTQDDLLTLRLEIGGEGYLGSIKEPALPPFNGWSKAGTQAKTEAAQDMKAFQGKKVFEILLRPEKTGKIEVPEIGYAFFDPSQGQYVEKSAGPFFVEVKPGTAQPLIVASTPTSSSARPIAPQFFGEQIAYIHPEYPGERSYAPIYTNPYFIGFQALPVAAVAFALGLRIRRRYIEQNQDALIYKSAGSKARKELREAQSAAQKGDASLFYRKLEEALREYLGIKLKRPAAGLTLEEIESACTAAGLGPQQTRSIRALLEQCEMARYSAGSAKSQVMQANLDECSSLLDSMDKHFG